MNKQKNVGYAAVIVIVIAVFLKFCASESSGTKSTDDKEKVVLTKGFEINGKTQSLSTEKLYYVELDGAKPKDYNLCLPAGYLVNFESRSEALLIENSSGLKDTMPEFIDPSFKLFPEEKDRQNNRKNKVTTLSGKPGWYEFSLIKK